MKVNKELVVSDEVVIGRIYFIRGLKVMLDRDLAELYSVETKQLKRQVNRNIERFPTDFMFELSKEEFENWRSQFGTSNSVKKGLRYAPLVFTEQGVAMLSSVLNSKQAIKTNIQIIRIFTRLHQMLLDNTELRLEIEKIKKKLDNHDKNIELVFQYLDQLIDKKEQVSKREKIGYQIPGKEQKMLKT